MQVPCLLQTERSFEESLISGRAALSAFQQVTLGSKGFYKRPHNSTNQVSPAIMISDAFTSVNYAIKLTCTY